MKIILIGTAYPHRGGIAHFNALLFQTLQKRGHDVSMISFTRQYPSLFFPGKTQYDEGEEAVHVNATPMLDSIDPFSWVRVAMRVREHNPDLIIFKYWMPFFAPAYATIAALVKAGRKTKVLYICDNIIPHEHRPGDRLLTKMALATVDHFIVMSQSVERDLLQFVPGASYRRVEHPVYEIFGKEYDRDQARKRLGIAANENVILFFGYIRRYKGLQLLLEAFPEVLKETPAKLLIAGEFYDEREPYLDLIRKYDLEKHVFLHDQFIPNEEVGLYFAAADMVALPYVSATQSGVIQIAYHFNRPVVATPVGGLPEVIEQEKTGYVVEEVSAPALAKGILHMIRLKHRVDFAGNVREYKKRFSWDHMAEAIEALLT